MAQYSAYTVLECTPVGMVHDALVDYGECQMMAVGSCTITRKRRYAFDSTSLGKHVALRECAAHASAQCAIDASLGQGWMQMQIDIIVAECVA